MRPSALSLMLIGLSVPGLAQTPDDTEKELLALMNTPIQGASKRDQRLLDSPQAIEVLTGDDIRQMGIYRLADALRLMTSVDVIELDTQGTYVTLRGATQQGTPRTVQFLIDGVPLYNGEKGSVDVDNFPVPLDLIAKVEVVRGPSSSLYGANAVVGVIAITTKRPEEGTHGGLRLSRASLATTRGAADLSLGRGGLGLIAGYSGASLGVDRETTIDLTNRAPVVLDANSAHQQSAFARAQYGLSGDGQVWMSVGEARKLFDVTSAYTTCPWQTLTTQTAQAGWRQTWAPTFFTEARVSHLRQAVTTGPMPGLSALFGDPALLDEGTWGNYTSTLLEVQANWSPRDTFHMVGGADRRTSSAGKAAWQGLASDKDVTASGGFLNLDWNFAPALALSLGARAENETLGGSRIAPRATLVWNPGPASSLRLGYYSSTRSPQILEKYNALGVQTADIQPGLHGRFEIAPNPDLKPEKVTSIEAGYRQQIATLTLDFTVFKMKFEQLITMTTTSAVDPNVQPAPTLVVRQQYINNGAATDQGLEATAKWLVSRAWSLGANLTWLDYKLEATGAAPAYVPKTKVNLWSRFAKGPFSAFLAYQHVDHTEVEIPSYTSVAALQTDRPAINQVHLNLGWEFHPGLAVGLYALNASRTLTLMGAGGTMGTNYFQGSRREAGATVSLRF